MSETLAQYQAANHGIVNLAAASLSAGPDLSEAERTARFQAVVSGAMAFQPIDPPQAVLASLILGHHLAIMDGFRDIACLTLTPAEAARARMVTVAQTKLVLQMARELRIARKEDRVTPERTPAERAPGLSGDAGHDAPLTKLLSAYADTLATLENTDTLTPAAAAKARQTLSQALSSTPGVVSEEEPPISGPVTGSRAQRRAMMKRRGQFKRTA